jgi:hypothetical protein
LVSVKPIVEDAQIQGAPYLIPAEPKLERNAEPVSREQSGCLLVLWGTRITGDNSPSPKRIGFVEGQSGRPEPAVMP